MGMTNFDNLDLLLGEPCCHDSSHPRLRRALTGAAVGCLIALSILAFIAAVVRWPVVLRLWPTSSIIGLCFGASIGLLHKRPSSPDARYGEGRLTGRPLDLR